MIGVIIILVILFLVGIALIKLGLKILFYPIISLLHQASLGKWGWFLITLLFMIPGYVLSYIPAIIFEWFIAEHVEIKQMNQKQRRFESRLGMQKKICPRSYQHIITVINSYILKNPDLEKDPFYLGTNVPLKKFTNARATYAPNINRKDVIYFIDLTVWGSGKKGVLLTGKSIYWDDDNSKDSVDYSEITHFEKKEGPAIFFNSEKLNLYMLNNKEHRTIIFDMIQDIIEADKKYHEEKHARISKDKFMSSDKVDSVYNKLRNGYLDRKLKKEAGLTNDDLEVIHLAYHQYGNKYGFKKDMMKDIKKVHNWLDYYQKTQRNTPKSSKNVWIEEDEWEGETEEIWEGDDEWSFEDKEENWNTSEYSNEEDNWRCD